MDLTLCGMAWGICLAYLDDIIIFAKTKKEHWQRLEMVLTLIQAPGLKVNPGYCNLVQTEVPFMGHVVLGEGVKLDSKIL